jgi:hypothetical protein
LEPFVEGRYQQNNPYVLYYLSIAYLQHGKIAAAASIITQCEKLFPNFSPLKEVLGFTALKSGKDKENVLVHLYRYHTEYPSSSKLKSFIKKLKSATNFDSFQREVKITHIVKLIKPPAVKNKNRIETRNRPGLTLNPKLLIIPVVIILGVITFFLVTSLFSPGLYEVAEEKLEPYRIDNSRYPLVDETETSKPYVYKSEADLLKDYESARKYIQKGEINQAVLLLNRILLSNANISVKDRSTFLKDFISKLDQKSYTIIDYSTLKADPVLYTGSFIIMEGKAANASESQTGGAFTLLINEKDDKFDGTMEIISDKSPLGVTNGERVKVSGEFLHSVEGDSPMFIRAEKIEKR